MAGSLLRFGIRKLLRLGSSIVGAALVGGLGWILAKGSLSLGKSGLREEPPFGWLCTAFAESLARLSYDVPFIVRAPVEMPEVCIIYLDESSGHNLGQQGTVWDRRLHAQLLRRLAQDRPRAIFFDIVFSDKDAEVDREFEAAIRETGNVFLGAAFENGADVPLPLRTKLTASRIIAPIEVLREACAGWGMIDFDPVDADFGVRRISTGRAQRASATWLMAAKLDDKFRTGDEARAESRWLNYYGPADWFPSVEYDRALDPGGTPAGTFENRIVFIGGRSTLSGVGLGKDDFRNPYGLLGGGFSTGVEVHLTTLLNLMRDEWLTRLGTEVHFDFLRKITPAKWVARAGMESEPWLALGFGLLLGGLLPRLRPLAAALFCGLAVAAVCIGAFWLLERHRMWSAWCVPVLVQAPVAFVWAVGARYFIEERRRIALGKAFGHYLSPLIAERVADADFDLAPGGTVVEASVLFTDLEGFTPLSEGLDQPELVTGILIEYFTQTTAPILDNDGMIINFVGDAVTAVWGAPLPQPDHASKAALAAWHLHKSARIEVDGHTLRTRVGFHTGKVLVGNVGSADRFDYAVVGDAVNFASRLEGLNKFLGTNVLLSSSVLEKLGDTFSVRYLGEFRVVGKKVPCKIYELLGPAAEVPRPDWCDLFENGIEAFATGDLTTAGDRMRETRAMRGGSDGPSDFYLEQIETLLKSGLPPDWDGTVRCDKK